MAKRAILKVHSGPVYPVVLGLSTQWKDYRLSFLLNQLPGFRFTRCEELVVQLPGIAEPVPFSLYTSSDEEELRTYALLSNRSSDHTLVPSLRQTDYFLIIEGPLSNPQKEAMLKAIRAIPQLLLAAEIHPPAISQLDGVITDLELHHMKYP